MSRFNFFGNISGETSLLMEMMLLLMVSKLITPVVKRAKRLMKSKKPQPKSRNYMLQVTYG